MGGEETAEGDLAKPTRRRKKRKAIFVQKKRRSSTVDYTPAGSPQVIFMQNTTKSFQSTWAYFGRVYTNGGEWSPNTTLFLLQDSDEGEEDEDMALQSGSEGTSSEPREDHTDTSSVEVTSSRPRRAAMLRRALSAGNPTSRQEAPEGRRRSTRSLSAYNQTTKYQPPKGQDIQVQTETTL